MLHLAFTSSQLGGVIQKLIALGTILDPLRAAGEFEITVSVARPLVGRRIQIRR